MNRFDFDERALEVSYETPERWIPTKKARRIYSHKESCNKEVYVLSTDDLKKFNQYDMFFTDDGRFLGFPVITGRYKFKLIKPKGYDIKVRPVCKK